MPADEFDLRCLLLDLDGTLLDTGPDMGLALNIVRMEVGLDELEYADIRPHVSGGSVALTRLGCPEPEGSPGFERFRERFLETYRENLTVHTALFDGMAEVLELVELAGVPWGVVTNKPSWLTEPLMARLALDARAACVISGDTTAYSKPHPMPLLEAAARTNTSPRYCAFVGDDERDVEAGRSAGMYTVAATFGYLGVDAKPERWPADLLVADTASLQRWCGTQLARR